jgi:hypothetical protein
MTRTWQQGQDDWDRTAGTVQPGQDNHETARTRQTGEKKTGQPGKVCLDKSVWTGQPDRSVWSGQTGHDRRDRTAKTGQPLTTLDFFKVDVLRANS